MSSFGAKRKARIIKVADDDDAGEQSISSDTCGSAGPEVSKPLFGSKNARKPVRQSALRKPFNLGEEENGTGIEGIKDDGDSEGPVVVRPNFGRKGSSTVKNRKKASKLSFDDDEGDDASEERNVVKPTNKFPLGKRALENSSLKKGLATRGLPMRSLQEDETRPRYDKEYLDELQSSTPNTPREVTLSAEEVEEMDIEEAELDGAMIVDSPDLPVSAQPQTRILSEAEISEKKERRDRLAKEQDFLSIDDDDEEDYLGRKKKPETRLKQDEDEEGEGFDNFVDDGGLSLGKRAEKERRKKDRKEMAELITAAEGHSSDDSSDSDAERRIAYESAQTNAGLDGLKKPRKDPAQELLQVPAKITPLPNLSECISRLQISLQAKQEEIKQRNARVQQLKNEKEEILKREKEVQALLDETGKKYQEALSQGKVNAAAGPAAGLATDFTGDFAPESLGTTPARVGSAEDNP